MGSGTTFKEFKCQWFLKEEVAALQGRGSDSFFCGPAHGGQSGTMKPQHINLQQAHVQISMANVYTCSHTHMVLRPSTLSHRHRGGAVCNSMRPPYKPGEDEQAETCRGLTPLCCLQKQMLGQRFNNMQKNMCIPNGSDF